MNEEKYGDASANERLREELAFRKRKVKSSPVIKKKLLKKVMSIIDKLKLKHNEN